MGVKGQRVVVPYVTVRWLYRIVLECRKAGADVLAVRLPRSDPTAYARLFASLWATAGDLVVVEHDVVPTAAQLADLFRCSHDWCGYRYEKDGRDVVRGLGCTKFSDAMRRELRGFAAEACQVADDAVRWVPWQSLDSRLAMKLRGAGYDWVSHRGKVSHRPT